MFDFNESAEKLNNQLSNMMNCFSPNNSKICIDLYFDSGRNDLAVTELFVYWMKVCSDLYDKGWYDDRNGASCKLGHDLFNDKEWVNTVNEYMTLVDTEYEHMYSEKDDSIDMKMRDIAVLEMRDHRTLQQSFTRLACAWFGTYAPMFYNDTMDKALLPFI